MLFAAWLFAFLGVAAIAVANQASSRLVTGFAASATRRRRGAIGGSMALVLCLALTIARDGPGFGLLLGPLLIICATAAVIALLTRWPRHLRPIARLLDR
jgi:hypothetical protein